MRVVVNPDQVRRARVPPDRLRVRDRPPGQWAVKVLPDRAEGLPAQIIRCPPAARVSHRRQEKNTRSTRRAIPAEVLAAICKAPEAVPECQALAVREQPEALALLVLRVPDLPAVPVVAQEPVGLALVETDPEMDRYHLSGN